MSKENLKTALVTGASRGIGAAIARRLAADGFRIVVNYTSNASAADAVVKEIEAAGGEAMAVIGDVSDADAVAKMFDAAEARFGGVDVLVNNAGVMELAPIAEMTDASFDRMIDINLKGSFNTMRAAAKRLRHGGRVINTSTTVTRSRLPNYAVYAATKAAVEVMTAIMAKETSPSTPLRLAPPRPSSS